MTIERTRATDGILRLPDGRRLAYSQFGHPAGRPVFFFHGGGDCRLQRHPDDTIAERLGIRLVAVDRPGIGLSDFKPRRRILDWPADVLSLAAALDLGRFGVLGYSMGAPYALACAYRLPDRVSRAGVVAGLGPFDWPGATDGMSAFHRRLFRYAGRSHRAVQIPLELARRKAQRDPAAWIDRGRAMMSDPDRAVYDQVPGRRENQIEAFTEVLKGRSRGLAWDLRVVTKPWGFRPEYITVPVSLWYGSEDSTAPPRIGEELARRIPDAELTVFAHEGHQCLFLHWEEMLRAVSYEL